MFQSIFQALSPAQWGCVIGGIIVANLLYSYLVTWSALRKFNGPFLASVTDFWRFCYYWVSLRKVPALKLHEKYGDVVRFGPNCLSFAQPEAIKDIYDPGRNFSKSGYYPVNATMQHGHKIYTLFSSVDKKWHHDLRKCINGAFTPGAAASYEYLVQYTIQAFMKKIEENHADKPHTIDLFTWFYYFSFDVIGDLTYSERHGFIEEEKDVHGIIVFIQDALTYGYFWGQMPVMSYLKRHNPFLMLGQRLGIAPSTAYPGIPYAARKMEARKQFKANGGKADREDLLEKFFKAREANPEIVGETQILSLTLTMMFAGSETTGITMTALFYFLLKHRSVYNTLRSEIDTHLPRDPNEDIRFSDARALPYLQAVVNETFRMHPSFAVMYERVVPAGGAMIAGHFVPAGTIVGVNPWVVQRNREVFGPDVDVYRPERWLDKDPARVKMMHQCMHQFGAGEYICLGRHVSMLEIYMVVPTMLRRFEIELERPDEDWTFDIGANVRMSPVDVKVRVRQDSAQA